MAGRVGLAIRRTIPALTSLVVTAVIGSLGFAHAEAQETSPAQALIAQQHASDVFEALPNPNARLVRHKQSGMLCLFANGTTADLEVFGEQRGQDVGCVQKQPNGAELAMFATHMPGVNPDQALGSMIRSMMKWSGWNAAPAPDKHPEITAKQPSAPPWPRAQAAFLGQLNGRPTFVRLAAATTPDGWVVTQRLVTPLDAKGGDPERLKADAHIKGEVIFSETLRVMAEERGKQ